jgi:RluA family pseudouridine synthase
VQRSNTGISTPAGGILNVGMLIRTERVLPMRGRSRPGAIFLPKGLEIIYEDGDILVVDKPTGLLTVATDKEKSRTAYFILTDYVRKGCRRSKNRIFVVHRLDRETSGVLVFAKTEEAKLFLQSRWKETKKKYLAIVHGRLEKRSETITTYLVENKAHGVYSSSNPTIGRLSHTAYEVLKQTKDFALLEVDLLTGRKHQIRVHLADIGHPVVGDQRYGKGDKVHKRLALHAKSISLQHPFSGAPLTFSTRVPGYFNRLVGSSDQTNARSDPADHDPAENDSVDAFPRGSQPV